MVMRYASTFQPKLKVAGRNRIVGTYYTFGSLLAQSAADAVVLTRKTLKTKDHIIRTEKMWRQRTTVSTYRVPSYVRDAYKAAY